MIQTPKISEVFQAMADELYKRHPLLPSGFSGGYSGMENRQKDYEIASVYVAIAEVHRKYGQ